MKNVLLLIAVFCTGSLFSQQETASIYFNLDESTIRPEEQVKIQAILGSSGKIISITGHCDPSGSEAYNLALSKRRIDATLKALGLGRKLHTVQLLPKGEQEANASVNAIGSPEKYRRVDIVFIMNTPPPAMEVEAEQEDQSVIDSPPASELSNAMNVFLSDSSASTTSFDLSILFQPGLPIPLDESIPELDELFRFMHNNQDLDLHIHGHVCCADDYPLSRDRAYMVYNYLIQRNINRKRLKYTGHSNKEPKVAPEVTEADRKANRRVSVEFFKR